MNHLWTGLWSALVYTTAILLTLNYYQPPEPFSLEVPGTELPFRESMTWAVLYGIFPAVLLGRLVWQRQRQLAVYVVGRWNVRPIRRRSVAAEQGACRGRHIHSSTCTWHAVICVDDVVCV